MSKTMFFRKLRLRFSDHVCCSPRFRHKLPSILVMNANGKKIEMGLNGIMCGCGAENSFEHADE